ncbi:MAG: hypothetical protein H6Q73_3263 [Firmicutes bacterium]|nr:hypothetical protein [Bacillota bacterium]
MEEVICANCYTPLSPVLSACPGCGDNIIITGEQKNIIDRVQPNCLIHRYDGSDLLEPAFIIKEGKTNLKAATKLKEYAKPITVPKQKTYAFDQNILSAIQSLRNERTASIRRYDQLIQSHWQQLKPYKPKT